MADERDIGECRFCGRSIPAVGVEDAEGRRFCSAGCRDVADALGVPDPRDREDGHEAKGAIDPSAEPTGESAEGESEEGKDSREDDEGTTTETGPVRTFLRVDNMRSVTCEAYLESVATGLEGVYSAEASYVTETIGVTHDPELSEETLQEALSTLGYTAYSRASPAGANPDAESTTRRTREMGGMRKRRDDQILEMRYATGLLFGAFLLLPYAAVVYPSQLASVVSWGPLSAFDSGFTLEGAGGIAFVRLYFVLTGLILLFTGLPVLRGAYASLRTSRPNTDLLVAATVMAAYVYSTIAALTGRGGIFYDLTLVVAAAVTAASYYEAETKRRAVDRLTELTVSEVDSARVYSGDELLEVPVESVGAGDRVLVREGERIPVDGTVESACVTDEAIVTGESLPVQKRSGDDAVGGSIVVDGAAVVRVGEAATSSIERLTTAVWALQSADHGIARRADRLASRLVVPLAAVAVLAALATAALGGGTIPVVLAALAVLLTCSPWGLGLATPLSVATSIERALERGIVVFDETVFERLRGIDTVVFDKTGTLTTGRMRVVDADAPPEALAAAAAVERRGAHPAANAIAAAFGDSIDEAVRADGGEPDHVSEFTTHARGVEGVVDGERVLAGDLPLFEERGWPVEAAITKQVEAARERGRLPVVVGRDGVAEGVIVVGDEPREGWAETVEALSARGANVVVLTGDDERAAGTFADHAGVTDVFAGVPPEGKTAAVRRLRERGRVAMVGDGTNDAPALAAADLGISLGGGTALAADAADVVVADDSIRSVEAAFEVASAAGERVRSATALSISYNAIAIPAVVAGALTPLTAITATAVCGGLIGAACLWDRS